VARAGDHMVHEYRGWVDLTNQKGITDEMAKARAYIAAAKETKLRRALIVNLEAAAAKQRFK
jgi:hypothetical protein